jgi:hypothetical protein
LIGPPTIVLELWGMPPIEVPFWIPNCKIETNVHSCSCLCMPPFLHCDRVSPRTQSVHDDAINGWCGETEDPTSVCLSATTTRTWCWNISGQVRLISGPRFCHLGGCRIGLAETVNGSKWTGSNRHTDRPSELIYRICCVCVCVLVIFVTTQGESSSNFKQKNSKKIVVHQWYQLVTQFNQMGISLNSFAIKGF